MKNFIGYALVVSLGFSAVSLKTMHAEKDDIVVRQIEAESNISQSDVDRWSFLWLGRLAQPAAAAGSAYAAYKAGTVGYSLATTIPTSATSSIFQPSRFPSSLPAKTYGETLVENVFKGEWTPQFIKDVDFNGYEKLLGNKWLWGGVGVAGVVFASYKLLYPRIEAGILNKIKNLERLCNKLAVAKESFSDVNALIAGMQLKKNITWHVNGPIGVEKGIDNLLEQCRCALLLIERLLVGGSSNIAQVDRLNISITGFGNNLRNNKMLVAPVAAQELAIRATNVSTGQNQQLADLKVKAASAGLAGHHIKNVAGVWKTLKEIAEFGFKHKTDIATLSIVTYGIGKYNEWFGGK